MNLKSQHAGDMVCRRAVVLVRLKTKYQHRRDPFGPAATDRFEDARSGIQKMAGSCRVRLPDGAGG